MNPLHPARIGAAVRHQLQQLGMGTRLFGRLLALIGPALGRPRLIGDQIHFLGNYSLVGQEAAQGVSSTSTLVNPLENYKRQRRAADH
jgi:hypothetical protein